MQLKQAMQQASREMRHLGESLASAQESRAVVEAAVLLAERERADRQQQRVEVLLREEQQLKQTLSEASSDMQRTLGALSIPRPVVSRSHQLPSPSSPSSLHCYSPAPPRDPRGSVSRSAGGRSHFREQRF